MSDLQHSAAIVGDRVLLDRAELIDIDGADAIAFAHAQFSSDVAALEAGTWQWSAWLTAQGRVRSVFVLLRIADDRLLVWLPLGDARTTRDALARYVLRAKVRLGVPERWGLWRRGDAAPPARAIVAHDGGYAFAQPGPKPRVPWLGPMSDAEPDFRALADWRLADIAAGLPWIAPAAQDAFVPQALDLERLDAIRFDKGCFPGQEIAARLHFRGGVKQRLSRILLRGEGDVLPGLRIEGADGAAGVVLYGAHVAPATHEALAVLAAATPDGAPLVSVGGHAVELLSDIFSI